jgi:hypothetical protein
MEASQLFNEVIYFGGYYNCLTLRPDNSFFRQERVDTSENSVSILNSSGTWEYSADQTLKLTITSIEVEDDCVKRLSEEIAKLQIPTVFETPNFCFKTSRELNYFKGVWGTYSKLLENYEITILKRFLS